MVSASHRAPPRTTETAERRRPRLSAAGALVLGPA
jgi:hypothetical protein